MKGDPKVIEHLNKALYNELIAINQYFLHAKMLKNWGLKELAEHEYHESIDEMKHADKLSERILFLDGLPNFQNLGKLRIGENPVEVLKADLALEYDALPTLKEAIAHCEQVGDYVSRELFADILESEEEHIDWIETQLAEVLEVRQALEEEDAFRQLVGVLHLVDGLVVLVLREFLQSPVLQHPGVQEILVDRDELVVERLVQVLDDLRIALHGGELRRGIA